MPYQARKSIIRDSGECYAHVYSQVLRDDGNN